MILEQQRKFKSNKLIWRVLVSFICADASFANASKVLENNKDKVRSKNWIRIRGFEDRIRFEYSNLEDFRKVSENHFFRVKRVPRKTLPFWN